jgi:peptidoglycan/LPS O-acetylase OafA/YrhL
VLGRRSAGHDVPRSHAGARWGARDRHRRRDGLHYYLFDHHIAPLHWFHQLTRSGWLGVDLFFVLSGFLITGILLDQREKRPSARAFFQTFYVRRTLRIFPLYYATLFVVFGVLAWTPLFHEPSFDALEREQIWLWLYAVNWVNWVRGTLVFVSDSFEANHFWSLAAEEQFYLLWPAIVWALSARTLARVSLGVVAASFLAKALLAPGEEALMLFRADGLVLGALLATQVRDPHAKRYVERLSRPTLALGVLALLVLFVLRDGLLHGDPWMARAGTSLVAVTCAAAVVESVRAPAESLVGRALRARALAFLGRYSYGIYVLHWAFHPLFDRWFFELVPREPTGVAVLDGLFVTLVKSAAAIGAAVAVHRALEAPLLKLKDRFAPNR